MDRNQLQVGDIYFGVSYEDDDELLRPILNTFEYAGEDERRPSFYMFKYLGTDDFLELKEDQLDFIVDLNELKNVLDEWERRTKSKNNGLSCLILEPYSAELLEP